MAANSDHIFYITRWNGQYLRSFWPKQVIEVSIPLLIKAVWLNEESFMIV